MSVLAFFGVIFHILDIVTDVFYIIDTPFYTAWLMALSILSLIAPILWMCIALRGQNDHLIKKKDRTCRNKTIGFLIYYAGLYGVDPFFKPNEYYEASLAGAKLIFVTWEDIPQFFIQTINTLYLG